jgi:hypothetical protein
MTKMTGRLVCSSGTSWRWSKRERFTSFRGSSFRGSFRGSDPQNEKICGGQVNRRVVSCPPHPPLAVTHPSCVSASPPSCSSPVWHVASGSNTLARSGTSPAAAMSGGTSSGPTAIDRHPNFSFCGSDPHFISAAVLSGFGWINAHVLPLPVALSLNFLVPLVVATLGAAGSYEKRP